MQAFIGIEGVTTEELFRLNRSVANLVGTITRYESILQAKLQNVSTQMEDLSLIHIFRDEALNKTESLYIGRGGISKDTTHWMVVDWRAPVANAYYENGLGKCSYPAPDSGHNALKRIKIDLKMKRTYEIEDGKLLDYYDSEVVTNDELLTKYLAKNKQAVLGEIIATIQKEQNDIIRKTPHHNVCLLYTSWTEPIWMYSPAMKGMNATIPGTG